MAGIETNFGFEIYPQWRERKGHWAAAIAPEGRMLKAGAVPMDVAGNVALVRRDGSKDWVLPKGHVDWQKTDEGLYATDLNQVLGRTAVQEAHEEAGLFITVGENLGSVDIENNDGHIYRAFYFAGRVDAYSPTSELGTVLFAPEVAYELVVPELTDIVGLALKGWSRDAYAAEIPTQPSPRLGATV